MGSHALSRMPPLVNCGRTGCLTVTELAGRVGISFSPPWHRHLRALEQSDAISGYHAYLHAVLGDPDYLSSGSNLCSCGPLFLAAATQGRSRVERSGMRST
jgi:hypothetical protein